MIKMISKSLFAAIALLFITTTTVHATAKVTTETANTNTVIASEDYCGVSESEIVQYLAQYGYIVKGMTSCTGSCNVIVNTQNSFNTIVYINPDMGIVGHEDIHD